MREKLKEAFINAELRLNNLESVVEEHNRKFQEASDFCQKLRKDFDHMQNSVPQSSTEPNLSLQAGLGDANKIIRDLHEKFKQSSGSISRLQERCLGLEQTSISRSEILDLQQRVAKMEHIFADFQSFKQEVTTSIQSVESRLSSHFEGDQRQVDNLLHRFSGFELEIAQCKSLLDTPLGGPPQQKVVGDDMLAWTNRMHHTVSELLLGLQHVHGLVH